MRAAWNSLFAIAVLLLAIVPSGLKASSWVSDFNSDATLSPGPEWLRQLPRDTQKNFAEVRFEINPPADASDLLLTVSFNEKPGGFLKVFWMTPTGSQMLSDNLYEGIDLPNQRSLLISQLVLKEKGILTFQSSQQDLNIFRIHWDWLDPKVIATSAGSFAVAALNANGKALTGEEISGNPAGDLSDEWKGSFITAPLVDGPQRIDDGIELQAELETAPKFARLEGWFSGLPLNKNLSVWINGHSQAASLEVPDFTDPGYQAQALEKPFYAGWRKMQLWVPSFWLQKGVNRIVFSKAEPEESYPMAIKNLSLQLSFPTPIQPQVSSIPSDSPELILDANPTP